MGETMPGGGFGRIEYDLAECENFNLPQGDLVLSVAPVLNALALIGQTRRAEKARPVSRRDMPRIAGPKALFVDAASGQTMLRISDDDVKMIYTELGHALRTIRSAKDYGQNWADPEMLYHSDCKASAYRTALLDHVAPVMV